MTIDLDTSRSRAPKQRLSEFTSWFKGNDNNPSHNNRFSVSFATPNILKNYLVRGKFLLETGDNANLLNYYADTVNLPSKQVTTGSITNVGSTYNYATSSTFSQISITFTMPRSHKTRTIFERWISIMSSDANQHTDYYEDYVCPNLYIYKWERGGGPKFRLPSKWLRKLKRLGLDEDDILRYHDDQLVGIYDLRNVFPYNIGSMSLTNAQADILKFDVGFYYERYRFYGNDDFDESGNPYAYSTGASADRPLDPRQNASKPDSTEDRNADDSRTSSRRVTLQPTDGGAT